MSRHQTPEMMPADYVGRLGALAIAWGEFEPATVTDEQIVADLEATVGSLDRQQLSRIIAAMALALSRVTFELGDQLGCDPVKVLDTRLFKLFGDRPDGGGT